MHNLVHDCLQPYNQSVGPLAAITIRNGKSAIFTKCLFRNAHPRCSLTPFVFTEINETRYASHDVFRVTQLNDFCGCAILLNIQSQDRIKNVIGRQTLIITLIGTQFG